MGARQLPPDSDLTFGGACEYFQELLRGPARRNIIATIKGRKDDAAALPRLRDAFRSQIFPEGSRQFDLNSIVRKWDSQHPREGFHVLHDWNGVADRLQEEVISVDVLQYFIGLRSDLYSPSTALAVLLDYHLLYVLAVLAVNAWTEGDANSNLDRINVLLNDLHGPDGSGHRFVENAESLILIATSHFEPDRDAYVRLLRNVRLLDDPHRLNIALVHAAILGSHLRHGFQDLYMRDLAIMREDNGPDYPWLFFAVETLLQKYTSLRKQATEGIERDRIVEALLNGMTPDPRALLGKTPPALASYAVEHAAFCKLFSEEKPALLQDFEDRRPVSQVYSPFALNFNFPHNAVKGLVAGAIVRAQPFAVPVNVLLTGLPNNSELEFFRLTMVAELREQARWRPDIIRDRPVPIFSYDHYRGVREFVKTLAIIKEFEPPGAQ